MMYSENSTEKSRASSETFVLDPGPGDWVRRLQRYSRRSPRDYLHTGVHLDSLAAYLAQPFEESVASDPEDPECDDEADFAILYDFQPNAQTLRTVIQRPSFLESIKERNWHADVQSQLLILRGHPSPAWINAIADAFEVSPEFFNRHIGTFFRRNVDVDHMWPLLASKSTREPKLRFVSRGVLLEPAQQARSKAYMHNIREKVLELFRSYRRDVRRETHVRVGESLLRGISVHDAAHFSYEQDISIWTAQTAKGYFALAWLDIGCHDLGEGPYNKELRAPLDGNHKNTLFGHTLLAEPLDNYDVPLGVQSNNDNKSSPMIAANGLHLWRDYSELVDPNLARIDSFAAIIPLFEFCAASESQFLNMVQKVIKNDVWEATVFNREDAALSNLLNNQLVLNEHVKQLKENVHTIERRRAWPHVPETSKDDAREIEFKSADLLVDFRGLLQRAQDLAQECERGIRRIEHIASLAESKKAIDQAKGVERLTLLATVFVPMSFTTSFFGMNFKEFGQSGLSVWIWFVVAVPVVAISLLLVLLMRSKGRQQRNRTRDIEKGGTMH